jgi:hypothetical protein
MISYEYVYIEEPLVVLVEAQNVCLLLDINKNAYDTNIHNINTNITILAIISTKLINYQNIYLHFFFCFFDVFKFCIINSKIANN